MARKPPPERLYREETTSESGRVYPARQTGDRAQYESWRHLARKLGPELGLTYRFLVADVRWEEDPLDG